MPLMNDCCLLSKFLPHTYFGIEVLRVLYKTTSLNALYVVLLLQRDDFLDTGLAFIKVLIGKIQKHSYISTTKFHFQQ